MIFFTKGGISSVESQFTPTRLGLEKRMSRWLGLFVARTGNGVVGVAPHPGLHVPWKLKTNTQLGKANLPARCYISYALPPTIMEVKNRFPPNRIVSFQTQPFSTSMFNVQNGEGSNNPTCGQMIEESKQTFQCFLNHFQLLACFHVLDFRCENSTPKGSTWNVHKKNCQVAFWSTWILCKARCQFTTVVYWFIGEILDK